ncbi:Gfo/Idh/MocA family protein [Acidobacteriota bacterium]
MKKCRVGLIGLGQVAQVCHLPGYKDIANIEVVAGADVHADTLNNVSSEWGLKAYTDYEKMIQAEGLDIVSVLTGPKLAPGITKKAAEYGVNILVEKPMALSLEEAESMIVKCKKEGVKLFYAEVYRFFPTLIKAKEMIGEGLLGDIFLMMETLIAGTGIEDFELLQIYPPGAPGAGGWGLMDHGIHLVDTFQWLLGSEPEWVFGRGLRSEQSPGTEFLTMQFKNKAIGQLVYNEATFPSDMPYEGIFSWGSYDAGGISTWEENPGNLRIHGSKGALRIFTFPNKMFYFGGGKQEQVRIPDRPHPIPFGLQMESFAQSLLDKKEPEVTGEDGLKALQIILAAYESYEGQKIIPIKPVS